MRILSIIIAVFLLSACTKKKTEEPAPQTVTTEAVSYDIPVLRGRNLDSLKSRPFGKRLLAFSIELGYRSKDFDQRLGNILLAKASGEPWKSAVLKTLSSENYKSAEQHNLAYLDSLYFLMGSPTQELKNSHFELASAFERFRNNYQILHDFPKFSGVAALLDTVLSNELVINRALRNFKDHIEPKL